MTALTGRFFNGALCLWMNAFPVLALASPRRGDNSEISKAPSGEFRVVFRAFNDVPEIRQRPATGYSLFLMGEKGETWVQEVDPSFRSEFANDRQLFNCFWSVDSHRLVVVRRFRRNSGLTGLQWRNGKFEPFVIPPLPWIDDFDGMVRKRGDHVLTMRSEVLRVTVQPHSLAVRIAGSINGYNHNYEVQFRYSIALPDGPWTHRVMSVLEDP